MFDSGVQHKNITPCLWRCLYYSQRPLDQQLGLPVECECSDCFTDHDLAESSPKHHHVFSHATL